MERVLGIYQALDSRTVSNYVESADSVAENLQRGDADVFLAPPRVWEQFYAAITVAATGGDLAAARPVQLGDRRRLSAPGSSCATSAALRAGSGPHRVHWRRARLPRTDPLVSRARHRSRGILWLSEAAGLTMATQADPVQRGKTRTGRLRRRGEDFAGGRTAACATRTSFAGYWRAPAPPRAIADRRLVSNRRHGPDRRRRDAH